MGGITQRPAGPRPPDLLSCCDHVRRCATGRDAGAALDHERAGRLHLLVLKLGDALAAMGKRDEARATLAQTRERADRQGESDLASAARARLTLLDNR